MSVAVPVFSRPAPLALLPPPPVLLPVMVQPAAVSVPELAMPPPPKKLSLFVETVLLVSVRLAPAPLLLMPPPMPLEVLAVTRQLLSVSAAVFRMPPPPSGSEKLALPFWMVRPLRVTVPAETVKTRDWAAPLMTTAPEGELPPVKLPPAMLTLPLVLTTTGPCASVIVAVLVVLLKPGSLTGIWKTTVEPLEASASVSAERREPGRLSSAVWVTGKPTEMLTALASGRRPAVRQRPSRAPRAARLIVGTAVEYVMIVLSIHAGVGRPRPKAGDADTDALCKIHAKAGDCAGAG